MALVRYEPSGIGQLQSEINRLFRSFGDWDSSGATAGWVPPVDIYEHGDRFQLYMDLPGVDPNSVEITLEGGVLTVSGERTFRECQHILVVIDQQHRRRLPGRSSRGAVRGGEASCGVLVCGTGIGNADSEIERQSAIPCGLQRR